jgi:hypothetical protein
MSLKDGRSGRMVLLLTEKPEWLHLGLDDEQGHRTVRILVHKQTLQLAIAATRHSGAVRDMPIVFGLRDEADRERAADAGNAAGKGSDRARVPLKHLATAHAGRGWRR